MRPGNEKVKDPVYQMLVAPRPLTVTITSERARKFFLWDACGDVLLVREAIYGRGSQVHGWITCAAFANYVWLTAHPLLNRSCL